MKAPICALTAALTVASCSAILLSSAADHRPTAKRAANDPVTSIAVTPGRTSLRGPYDEIHILVDGRRPSGHPIDLTGKAVLTCADPKIAVVDKDGVLRGKADGKTTLSARYQRWTVRIPVVVRGISHPAAPQFTVDVMPVLTKAGCNMGACHGAGAGKGGFKLSLLGYDPDADYEVITRGSGARRVAPAQPENSLLLRKPAFVVFHKGGQRFRVGSPEYRLLRDWIAAGMPPPTPKEPRVIGLETAPAVRTLAPGQHQKITVWAKYSDGTKRDATGQTVFTASDESVASVTPNGEAKVNGPGEGAIILRYQGLVATSRIVSPYAVPIQRPAGAYSKASSIDRLVGQKLDSLGLPPSDNCTDSDFLRRAYLDVIGLLPTPQEARAFLTSRDPQKRVKLVDALLARPEYVDFWTLRWADILRCNRRALGDKGMAALYSWIREGVAENKPWDQFARELLLAQGSTFSNGATNYFRTATSPNTLAETTSQVFLGVRIECAKCHNHPYERWTQNQYYQMAAFFARVGSKTGDRKDEPVVILANSGEVRHPKTGKEVAACALDSTPLKPDFSGDRRAVLADWLTSANNPFFAHEVVNRLWKHYLGRGLVEPVDDLRATNPPSNPALFDALADDFTRHKYDLKYLMRAILLSQTYQRSPLPTKANDRDVKYYSHYAFKRIDAEPLMDAIASATGVADKFDGYPAGFRATQLPDTGVGSYFLDLFGRPARNVACECERSADPNLGQILHLMNDKDINSRIASKTGRIAGLLAAKADDRKITENLYLATYSRYPAPTELKQAVTALATAKNRQQAAEDILWALLNSKEFVFSH